jgi:co-chaperonin GroES (HSP10)
MPHMPMQHDVDPAKLIWDQIGDLSKFQLYSNQILLGVYKRPEKTKSNLYLPDQTRKEDEYQGKAALVLMKGPSAFQSDENYDFKGQDVQIGDWVAIFVSDGRKIVVNGQLCRLVEDHHIRMKIPAPDSVF